MLAKTTAEDSYGKNKNVKGGELEPQAGRTNSKPGKDAWLPVGRSVYTCVLGLCVVDVDLYKHMSDYRSN